MKRLIAAAFALSLLNGASAFAQDDHHDHAHGGPPPHGAAGPHQGQPHGPAPHAPPPPHAGGPGPRGPAPRPEVHASPPPFRGGPGPQRGFDHNRGPAPGPQAGRFDGRNGGADRRSWGQGRVWTAPRRFHARAYYFPRGYGYQAWSFGQYLPGPFFESDYVLYDFAAYGLQPPPAGFEWIRVGPDALLVHEGDGYILDVVRGLFW